MAAAALCALWAVAVHLPSLRVPSSPTLERGALSRIRAVAARRRRWEAGWAALASRPRVIRSGSIGAVRPAARRHRPDDAASLLPEAAAGVGRRFTTVARRTRARRKWERAAPTVAEGEKSAEFDPTKDVRNDGPGGGRGPLRRAAVVARPAEHQGGADALAAARPGGRRGGDGAGGCRRRTRRRRRARVGGPRGEPRYVDPIAPGVGVDPADPPDAPPLFANQRVARRRRLAGPGVQGDAARRPRGGGEGAAPRRDGDIGEGLLLLHPGGGGHAEIRRALPRLRFGRPRHGVGLGPRRAGHPAGDRLHGRGGELRALRGEPRVPRVCDDAGRGARLLGDARARDRMGQGAAPLSAPRGRRLAYDEDGSGGVHARSSSASTPTRTRAI